MPGLHGPLVDEEGFPRADIDVHSVREARHKLACLKTDYRELQRRLEDILLRLHADRVRTNADELQGVVPGDQSPTGPVPPKKKEQPPRLLEGKIITFTQNWASFTFELHCVHYGSLSSSTRLVMNSVQLCWYPLKEATHTTCLVWSCVADEGPAFAVVDVVHPGSPSSTAGIVAGDRLLRLGSLRLVPSHSRLDERVGGAFKGVAANTNAQTRPVTVTEIFQLLPEEVASHENERIAVVLQRGGRILPLWLIPRRWQGKGLLGCHLKPLQLS